MTTLHLRKSIGRSPLRVGSPRVQRIWIIRGLPRVQPTWIIRGFLLIPLALACFALSPRVQAVVPAPDGGYGPPNYGVCNTAEGNGALFSLTTGVQNTAIGCNALSTNTSGENNTATGRDALGYNTTASGNTATGSEALLGKFNGSTGSYNTANGASALYSNSTGNYNTATCFQALLSNTIGLDNTAMGVQALYSNTTGISNTATGLNALFRNTTGSNNTANGYLALQNNTTGVSNTANGFQALYHNTGSNNTGLGYNAGGNLTTGNGNVCIGAGVLGVAGESNTTRIRNVYTSMTSGRAVYVNASNKIGTLMSSRRFKEEIKLMDKASETILALKPVTFRYKKEIEPNGAIMFGLIAEEVEKVDPSLVTRNDKGEVETVRYEAVNAMLLNEFLKEHRKVEDYHREVQKQEATIAQLKQDFQSRLADQQKQIEALTVDLQKVSEQISRPVPQVVNNP